MKFTPEQLSKMTGYPQAFIEKGSVPNDTESATVYLLAKIVEELSTFNRNQALIAQGMSDCVQVPSAQPRV